MRRGNMENKVLEWTFQFDHHVAEKGYDILKRINIDPEESNAQLRATYDYRFEYNLRESADNLEKLGAKLMRFQDLQTKSTHATAVFATPAFAFPRVHVRAHHPTIRCVSLRALPHACINATNT